MSLNNSKMDNFQTYVKNKLALFHKIEDDDNLSQKDCLNAKCRVIRCMYLYASRFLKNNCFIIDSFETKKSFRNLLQTFLKKSYEHSNTLNNIILNEIIKKNAKYNLNSKELRYLNMSIKNIKHFISVYYDRKTKIATLLSYKVKSNDLCRKITTYLY